MNTIIDFSAAFPQPAAVRDAGHVGVMCYVSNSRPGSNFGAKPLTKTAARMYLDAGLTVTCLYQYGKTNYAPAPSDWTGGRASGIHHASEAKRMLGLAGLPLDSIVYAPVDDNPTIDQWNGQVNPFLQGWIGVFGRERTGVYCNGRCIDWSVEDDLQIPYFMQHGWDARPKGQSIQVRPQANLVQVEIDKRKVGGVGVDLNEIIKADYGQVSLAAPTPAPQGAASAVYRALAGDA